MAPPRARKCPREGCTFGEDGGPYVTDPACDTLEEVRNDLRDHLEDAHDSLVANEVKQMKAKAELAFANAKEKEAEARKVAAENGGQVEGGSSGGGTPRAGERRTPLSRPAIEEDCTESDWSFFLASWTRYTSACKLEAGEEINHLWSACSESLQKQLHNKGAEAEMDKEKFLGLVKQLAVKKRNNLVNVITFQQMAQERDEGVHAFLARLNGQAELCDLTVPCPEHGCSVSFKERLTMLQLVRGLQDLAIQERVLQEAAAVESGELSLVKVTKLVEAAEMGKSSQASITKAGGLVGRLSEHRRGKDKARQDKRGKSGKRGDGEKPCSCCGNKTHGSSLQERREFPCPAFDIKCRDCGKVGHFDRYCSQKPQQGKPQEQNKTGKVAELKEVQEQGSSEGSLNTVSAGSVAEGGDFFRLSVSSPGSVVRDRVPSDAEAEFLGLQKGSVSGLGSGAKRIPHLVCDRRGQWAPGSVEEHDRVTLTVSVCERPYRDRGWSVPENRGPVEMSGLTDMGAQMCVAGHAFARSLGLGVEDLVQPELQISVADNVGLNLVGAVMVMFSGPGGVSTGQDVYIARGVAELFLSKSACRDLGMISATFPTVGEFPRARESRRRRSSSAPPRRVRFEEESSSLQPLTSAGVQTSAGNLGVPSVARGELQDDVFASVDVVTR